MIKNYWTYIKESFKVGDKVICIEPKGSLVLGEIYTIIEIYKEDDLCDIKGINGENYGGWYVNRFILAEPEDLKKWEEKREKDYIEHLEVDPYGEENWSNEGIKWYKKGEFEEDPNPNQKTIEYDDFITDDDFRNFLIDNNCYDSYIKNTKSYIKQSFLTYFKSDPLNIIDNSLTWSSTPEGRGFWGKIHRDWIKYCSENEIHGG